MWHCFRDRNLYQVFVKLRGIVFHNSPSKREFCKIRLHESQILRGPWNEFIHVIFIFIFRFLENFDSKRFFHIVSFGRYKFSAILCNESCNLPHEEIKTFPGISVFFIFLRTNSIKYIHKILWSVDLTNELKAVLQLWGVNVVLSMHSTFIT